VTRKTRPKQSFTCADCGKETHDTPCAATRNGRRARICQSCAGNFMSILREAHLARKEDAT